MNNYQWKFVDNSEEFSDNCYELINQENLDIYIQICDEYNYDELSYCVNEIVHTGNDIINREIKNFCGTLKEAKKIAINHYQKRKSDMMEVA